MDMQEKVVKLPGKPEIMKRLKGVNTATDEYMAERFYPLIAEAANRELVANGVLLMFYLKIQDFMKDGGYPPMMGNLMHYKIPAWVDALIDDKDVAEEIKRLHKELMAK